MYEIDKRKVAMVIAVPAAIILILTVIFTLACSSKSKSDRWVGDWNREGDSTFSRSHITVLSADSDGFIFSAEIYNGNRVADAKELRALFHNKERTYATYEIADTDAYIEFTLEDNVLTVSYISKENVQWDVIPGFSYGANIEGVYQHGDVEYLNTSLSQMEIISEQRDELLQKALTDAQYARLMDCFQMWELGRNENVAADVYYGRVTGNDFAAIVLFYDDGSYSLVISEDGTNNMSYLTTNSLYTPDLGAYPEPIQDWLKAYEEAYYSAQNS